MQLFIRELVFVTKFTSTTVEPRHARKGIEMDNKIKINDIFLNILMKTLLVLTWGQVASRVFNEATKSRPRLYSSKENNPC